MSVDPGVRGVVIDASGIAGLEAYFDAFPAKAAQAMSIAINYAARGPAIDLATEQMYKEVNFPPGYIEDDRLGVKQFSTPTQLEAVITGRDRPTSLARFQEGATFSGKRGKRGKNAPGAPPASNVTVTIHPGEPQPFPGAFLVGLFAGKVLGGNVGFAIRLRPGDPVRGKSIGRQPVQIWPGVFLLYSVSVDQAFGMVRHEIAPAVMDALEKEFIRQ
ncbi:MAG TPA: hypothetical protein VLJ39_12880, partial [Tepidisphaeraceae bacterium]|nr:hypothetical protein [Tepidisphaeraceae bacterium]